MGAAGSIVTNAQGEVNIATNPNVEPPLKAPSKTSQAVNMKSKFPSILPPQSPGQVAVKKDKNPTFRVTLAHPVPFIRDLQPLRTYLLRVSLESLDIISEGENNILTRQETLFCFVLFAIMIVIYLFVLTTLIRPESHQYRRRIT